MFSCSREAISKSRRVRSACSVLGFSQLQSRTPRYLSIYSYFEKGCRKKCTRQGIGGGFEFTVLQRNLKELARNRKAMKMCLEVLTESNKSRFDSYSRQEQCIDHAHFFPTAFLEIAVYCKVSVLTSSSVWRHCRVFCISSQRRRVSCFGHISIDLVFCDPFRSRQAPFCNKFRMQELSFVCGWKLPLTVFLTWSWDYIGEFLEINKSWKRFGNI